ncbi:uncharacterized protein BX663DRAFT_551124 [Cokeromyces recurvatus]|uniref:uncharacterized protein n=1 Tax=Cokeromyces recurvatus TaxID=90255 RepID=UPI0022205756|nr:uncharacterized protein BX663DRAFT_551124 [Cokeromyces recurvatus]KAI7904071.1 hypothetical protein BX663DRAFT_551124 [Cokeromyces recurvatus]
MGLVQSKTQQEPIIFYNPNVPLQFSQSLVGSLEKKVEQSTEKQQERHIEHIVQQRVAEELEKIKQKEAELKKEFHVELKEQNAEKDDLNALDMNEDIEAMIKRIARSGIKELPAKVKQCQDEVIACYNKNKSRSLDCWKEVDNFKQAVAEEQKKFVAAHQK